LGCKECEMERVQENKEMIEELSGVPVLGLLPFFEGEFTKEEVLESAKEHIMISKLEEFIQNESNVAGALSI
ncbi:dethiobiotin synthase, partial [Bacillus sp. GMa5/2]